MHYAFSKTYFYLFQLRNKYIMNCYLWSSTFQISKFYIILFEAVRDDVNFSISVHNQGNCGVNDFLKSCRGFRYGCINDAVWNLYKKKQKLRLMRGYKNFQQIISKVFFPHVLIYLSKKIKTIGVLWRTHANSSD